MDADHDYAVPPDFDYCRQNWQAASPAQNSPIDIYAGAPDTPASSAFYDVAVATFQFRMTRHFYYSALDRGRFHFFARFCENGVGSIAAASVCSSYIVHGNSRSLFYFP